MQMEPQLSLDCGACFRSNNIFHKDGTSGVNVTSHAQDNVSPQLPAKKQTRHWAAWTRQEEESFFTALRQFGKNFEKITRRVQSKNKDQVRHYYYRLVRRMNKLLGPELCLDAKNSKDTNAAMLCWWSLLEKDCCKASKLHLKPRTFKIFLDTLEHQLLKDRRKNVRIKRAQGEICSTTASATVYSQGKASLNDSRSVKIVLLDSQNIQTLGSGKGSSLKRTKAAYKRWEKAAIAGVSLVADAAVHLQRTGVDEVVELVKETQGEMGVAPGGKVVPSLPTLQNLLSENNVQNSTKLKLQLFPIDETTRRALEMDNHNPHLELTLSTRKKISSVLEHLNRKWGKSSIACGELGLLPYCIQKENLVNCQRWTQDSSLSAADVYAQIGSPSLFRLRYCWFSNADHEAATCQAPLASPSILDKHKTNMNTEHQNVDLLPYFTLPSEPMSDKLNDHCKDQVVLGIITELVPASTDVHTDMIECISTGPDKNILDPFDNPPVIYLPRDTCNVPIMGQVEEKDLLPWKRMANAHMPPKKKGRKGSTSSTPSTSPPQPKKSKKRALIDEEDPAPFLHPGVPHDHPFIPTWGVRTEDSIFGDTPLVQEWFHQGIPPFDRSQLKSCPNDAIISKGIQSGAMSHAYQSEAYRRLGIQTELISELESDRYQRDTQIQQLQKQMDELSLTNQKLTESSAEWEKKYNEEVQRSGLVAQQVVANWRASGEFSDEVGKAMAIHGETIYLKGWKMSTEHTLLVYPDLDPLLLMEPAERVRHDRRVRKAAALFIQLEDLDDAAEYAEDDEADDDDDDDDDASGALITHPNA